MFHGIKTPAVTDRGWLLMALLSHKRAVFPSCHQLGTCAHSGFYGSFQTKKLFDQYRAMPSEVRRASLR